MTTKNAPSILAGFALRDSAKKDGGVQPGAGVAPAAVGGGQGDVQAVGQGFGSSGADLSHGNSFFRCRARGPRSVIGRQASPATSRKPLTSRRVQENRSFDHACGPLRGVRGFNGSRALTYDVSEKL